MRKLLIIGAVLIFLLSGCASDDSSGGTLVKGTHVGGNTPYTDSSDDVAQEDTDATTGLYRVLAVDDDEGYIRLEDLDSGLLRDYDYGLYTEVFDKNNVATTDDSLNAGLVVSAEITENVDDGTAKLQTVKVSDAVWTMTDVTNFTVDEDEDAFYIGETIYRMTDDTKVFSGDTQVHVSTLTGDDTVTVIGDEKNIISVLISTGHGTVHLKNSEDFVGGWITIGKRYSSEITENMTIELPEGTYTLAVTNTDGYGDSTEIEVVRNEMTEVDLSTLKGEGPKICKLRFDVKTKGAKVYLNGEKQKTGDGKVNEVKYGVYTLLVKAKGYDDWSVRLMVSSEEATITIDMDELSSESDSTDSSDDSSTSTEDDDSDSSGSSSSTSSTASSGYAGSYAGSLAGSLAGSSAGSSSSSSSSSSSDTSGISSLGSIISALTGTSSSSSSTSSSSDTLSTISSIVDIIGGSSD